MTGHIPAESLLSKVLMQFIDFKKRKELNSGTVLDADLKGVKGAPDTFCVIDLTGEPSSSKEKEAQTTNLNGTLRSSSGRKLSSVLSISKRPMLDTNVFDKHASGGLMSSGSSPPSVERKPKQFRTSVIPKESNPFWNEGFIRLVIHS